MQRMPGWISRADRKDVRLAGSALLADGRQIPVEITNLSSDGCQVVSNETIGIGELIQLSAPPLEQVTGTIRWSLFGNAGVRFTGIAA